MATTLGSTGVTFPDGTTQTTASGGAPTTAQVLSATAGASYAAVGTYVLASPNTQTDIAPGTTRAGSSMVLSGFGYSTPYGNMYGETGSTLSGTWRAMSWGRYRPACNSVYPILLWLRIS